MDTYFSVAEIIISIVLIVSLLLQMRGSTFSGTFSSDSSVFRTRRGVEKTVFQLTIVLAVLFLIISVGSVIVAHATATTATGTG